MGPRCHYFFFFSARSLFFYGLEHSRTHVQLAACSLFQTAACHCGLGWQATMLLVHACAGLASCFISCRATFLACSTALVRSGHWCLREAARWGHANRCMNSECHGAHSEQSCVKSSPAIEPYWANWTWEA